MRMVEDEAQLGMNPELISKISKLPTINTHYEKVSNHKL
jgi:hypothetical protein